METPHLEKKYKPLNTPSNSAKEIKVKIIPPQRESQSVCRLCGRSDETSPTLLCLSVCVCVRAAAMECTGFLDALNSAPVPGIKIKKKKPGAAATPNAKAVSPTTNKVRRPAPHGAARVDHCN